VGLHFGPKKDIAKHDAELTREYAGLIKAIDDLHHPVVVTRGAAHFKTEEGFVDEIWHPEVTPSGLRTVRAVGQLALSAFGVVRDYGGKLVAEGAMPRLLNDPKITAIDRSKIAFHRIAGEMQVATTLVEFAKMEEIAAMLGDELIIKPDKGSGGRSEVMLKKDVEALAISGMDIPHVVQELMDLTIPFPDTIKGIDAEAEAKLKLFASRRKELRLFFFRGPDSFETVPLVRFMKLPGEKNDIWVPIAFESVPEKVEKMTKATVELLVAETGVQEIHGAIDSCYGTTARTKEAKWRVLEGNFWKPMGKRTHHEVEAAFDSGKARQLVRMAKERAAS